MWYIVAGVGLILFGVAKLRPRKKKGYQYFAQSSEWHHNQQRKKRK